MRSKLIAAALAVAVASPVMTAVPVSAQSSDRSWDDRRDNRTWEERRQDRRDRRRAQNDYEWRGDQSDWDAQRSYRQGNYRERRLTRDDTIYRGRDGRSYCRRNDGTTGLVIGAVGGGVLGNVLGGKTLGTLLGAGAGGLLGREVDRGKVRCR